MASDLSSDVVLPRLGTAWIGRSYFFEPEVDSTNTQLAEHAKRGATHGTVLVADTQTRGRGRFDRTWQSPVGQNLYFSVLLRPDWTVDARRPVSLAAGVALAEAVEPLLPTSPELKWPNDLLSSGRKLAGILVESAVDRQTIRHLVLGIGLNVNQQAFPEPIADLAGSLSLAAGRQFDRAEVLATVLGRLEVWVDRLHDDGPEPIVTRLCDYAPWMGKQISVRNGEHELVGTALGIEPHGALRLQDEQGEVHSIVSGDVLIAM